MNFKNNKVEIEISYLILFAIIIFCFLINHSNGQKEISRYISCIEERNDYLEEKLTKINNLSFNRDYYWADLLDDIENESEYEKNYCSIEDD